MRYSWGGNEPKNKDNVCEKILWGGNESKNRDNVCEKTLWGGNETKDKNTECEVVLDRPRVQELLLLPLQLQKKPPVSVAYFCEGAASEGAFHHNTSTDYKNREHIKRP